VQDLRAALAIMSASGACDPTWVPAPLVGPTTERPIRVSMVLEGAGPDLETPIADAVRRAGDALADAGYVVEESTPPSLERAAELYFQAIFRYGISEKGREAMRAIASPEYGTSMDAHWDAYMEAGGEPSHDPMADRFAIASAWNEWMVQRPLILAPVTTRQPLDAGFDQRAGEDARAWMRSLRMVVVANFLGLPSVAVPVGQNAGLPQGVQLIGSRFREDLCLDAAEAIERRLDSLTPIDPRAS
jgi:amidase